MIGFNAVIGISTGTMATAAGQFGVALQLPNRRRIAGQLVRTNLRLRIIGVGERPLQEAFAITILKPLTEANPDDWPAAALVTRACAESGDTKCRADI